MSTKCSKDALLLCLKGNAGNTFSIDDRLGFISVARPLDRMVQAEFNLVVQAADHGQPSLSSTADVHIIITVSNNAPPKFYLTEMATELQVITVSHFICV